MCGVVTTQVRARDAVEPTSAFVEVVLPYAILLATDSVCPHTTPCTKHLMTDILGAGYMGLAAPIHKSLPLEVPSLKSQAVLEPSKTCGRCGDPTPYHGTWVSGPSRALKAQVVDGP